MSKKTDNALRLVIVDERVEDAEALVSGLRNAGIAVRPVRAATREELSGALSGPADLVLAALTVQALPFEDTMQLVTGTGKDLPVVAIAERLDEAEYDALLNAGARGVALRHRPQQVLSQVRNEWADLDARRGHEPAVRHVRQRQCGRHVERAQRIRPSARRRQRHLQRSVHLTSDVEVRRHADVLYRQSHDNRSEPVAAGDVECRRRLALVEAALVDGLAHDAQTDALDAAGIPDGCDRLRTLEAPIEQDALVEVAVDRQGSGIVE